MKALKSPLAASILSSSSGTKAIREWLASGTVEGVIIWNGKVWEIKIAEKAK